MAKVKRNDFEKRYPNPRIRWDDDLLIFPYLVRKEPLPIPAPGSQDNPVAVFQVNERWLSHVLGVLSVLEQPDSWQGTPEQVYAAQQEVEQIIASITSVASFLENALLLYRVKPGEPYILQRLNLTSGQYEDFFVLDTLALVNAQTGTIATTGSLSATGMRVETGGNIGSFNIDSAQRQRINFEQNSVLRARLEVTPAGDQFHFVYDSFGTLRYAPFSYFYIDERVRIRPELEVDGNLDVTGTKNFLISHPLDDDKYLRYTAVEGPQAYVTHTGTATLVNGTALVDVDAAFGLDAGTLVALVKNSTVRVWLQAGAGQWPQGNLVYDVSAQGLRIRDVSIAGTVVPTSNIDVHWQLTAVRDDAAIRDSTATDDNGNLITQPPKRRDVNAALALLRDTVDALIADGQPRDAVEAFIRGELRGVAGWNSVGDVPQTIRQRITSYLDDAFGGV